MLTPKLMIIPNITLGELIIEQPKIIYISAHTCWWTHSEDDLQFVKLDPPVNAPEDILKKFEALQALIAKSEAHIPTDPSGSPLMQIDNFKGFLKSTMARAIHYGKHGLQAFMSAHHRNCYAYVPFTENQKKIHACAPDWKWYNTALDVAQLQGRFDLVNYDLNLLRK
jgi:hypothetical protein